MNAGTATITRSVGVTLPGIEPSEPGGGESGFQDRVIGLAHSLGYMVAHFRNVRIQRADGSCYFATPVQADGAGFPDLLMVRADPPRIVVAELKAGKNKTSDKQDEWLSRFRAVGIKAYVWYPKHWKKIEATLRGK